MDRMRRKSVAIVLRLHLLCLVIAAAATGMVRAQDSTERGLGKQIIGTKQGTWRSATVFTHAIWNDLLFYGAGSGCGGGNPRHEMEIGVFHLNGPAAGSHDSRNPVVTRAQFGLNEPGKGITPLSILEVDDTLFMFCTSRPDDDLQPRIVVITASVERPLKWSNYSIVIDETLSRCRNNHGASAIINPDDKTEVLVYFAACTPPNEYRILLAAVPVEAIANKRHYRLLKGYKHPVLKRENAKANYPFVRYAADRQKYELWYSGHTRADSPTRSIFRTVSKRKDDSEPAAEALVNPSGLVHRNDKSYATGPKIYGEHLYYSGRKDARGTYVGIFSQAIAKE